MGRLIDSEILAEKVKSLRMILVGGPRSGKGFFAECMKQYRESILRIIEEQPTVDDVPVVHGRWILTKEPLGWQEIDCIECSVCQASFVLGEMDFDDVVDCFKFCPNCGKPMDKGE